MKIVLILGCWGYKDGLKLCEGVSNEILDISLHTSRNELIIEFLDNHKLFDRPLYNNIHTVLWNLQDKFSEKNNNVFSEKYFRMLEEFCILHKKCGLYLRLDIKE